MSSEICPDLNALTLAWGREPGHRWFTHCLVAFVYNSAGLLLGVKKQIIFDNRKLMFSAMELQYLKRLTI